MAWRAAVIGMLALLLAGCDQPAPAPVQAPAADAAKPVVPAPDDEPLATDEEGEGEGDPEPTPPDLDPAPWSAAPLAAADVPAVYLQQWRKADNRATCALLAPVALQARDAKPRAANFSGGWAVAYDEPGLRSAFGIAGAGVE